MPEILIIGDTRGRSELERRVAKLGYQSEGCSLHAVSERLAKGPAPAAIMLCATGSEAAALMASLRRSPQGAAVPVTLYGQLGGQIRDLADVLDLGADHFLEEPARDDQLLSVLEALAGPPYVPPSDAGTAPTTDENLAHETPASERLDARDDATTPPASPTREARDPVLGQLHRTLDRLDDRHWPQAPDDEAPDDLELSILELHDVPEPSDDLETDHELDPPEPSIIVPLADALLSSDDEGAPPRESTVLIEQTSIIGPSLEGRASEVEPGATAEVEAPMQEHCRRILPLPVELEGRIETTEVPRLLWTLSRARFTGVLEFERDRAEKQLWLRDGAIVFARSNVPADRLIANLYRAGALSERQYESARRLAATDPRRAGEVLVEAGFVKRAELPELVRAHLLRIVDSTFSWTHGIWRLRPGETCEEAIVVEEGTARIIADGVRLRLQAAVLWELLGGSATVPMLKPRALGMRSALVHELGLGAGMRELLDQLDGTRSLGVLAEFRESEETELLGVVYTLHVLGLCELMGEPITASPAVEPDEIDRERIETRLRLAREADYFALLGLPRDATSADVVLAHASLRKTFEDDAVEATTLERYRLELEELRNALDVAAAVLREEGIRLAYLAHLEDS